MDQSKPGWINPEGAGGLFESRDACGVCDRTSSSDISSERISDTSTHPTVSVYTHVAPQYTEPPPNNHGHISHALETIAAVARSPTTSRISERGLPPTKVPSSQSDRTFATMCSLLTGPPSFRRAASTPLWDARDAI
eukprot:312402-Prymnesium_polylepis.2